jgi:hypothetical protein
MPANQEIPVYPMTAIDEITYRTPDALLNGESVISVIQSCIPAVLNAWAVPATDLDAMLVAIRIASYGHEMEINTTCPKCGHNHQVSVDLRAVLDKIVMPDYDTPLTVGDLICYFAPMTYKQISESALKTFETQKIMQVVNNDKLEEAEKLKLFKESFSKLTDITLGMVRSSIIRIDSSEGSTDNQKFITEFIENVDKDIFNKIQEHLDRLRELNTIKPVTVTITDEMREKGFTGETVEVPMVFDPATFFV